MLTHLNSLCAMVLFHCISRLRLACTYTGVILLATILFTSCTRTDDNDKTDPTEGYVRIYPDNSTHTPSAMTYHFYNTDSETEYIVSPCDGTGNFEGLLPIGSYRVIATNTDAANVTFSQMERYETAMVTANTLATRDASSRNSYTPHPGNVYSVVTDLTVSSTDPADCAPVPSLLTHTVNLTFTLMDGLEVNMQSLSGTLRGVFPAIYLHNGEPQTEEIDPSTCTIDFAAHTLGQEALATIGLFGICDPGYGANYTNAMNLELTTTDGVSYTFEADLTEVFSQITTEYGYNLPIELPIDITIERTEVGLDAKVTNWLKGGGTDVDGFRN